MRGEYLAILRMGARTEIIRVILLFHPSPPFLAFAAC
jgi:hypothetical protein